MGAGASVAAAGVRVAKSEGHGESAGSVGVGLKAVGGPESISGRGVLLEAHRGQSGSKCTAETPVDCHLFCLCATAVSHGTTYVVLTLSLLIRPVWPSTYDELVSLSQKKKYTAKARVQAEPPAYSSEYVLFADAAPVGLANFFVGLYLPLGGMRMFQCPRWVSTLQAAELWGWVKGVRLAAYMKWPRVCVGSDSTVARYQGQTGAGFLLGSATYPTCPVLAAPLVRDTHSGFFCPL